ncbi:hypothetical protein TWF696_000085 [Orbilia brochopaga]|uniref:Uncharacterized protein n=1 Tax=Orbilia brochopaga TaxID=3140254 RepID=A0AAV9VCL7_9PEZI
MAVLGELVGCCGCGRSRESRGDPQSENSSSTVIERQPSPVTPPRMVVIAYEKVKQKVTSRSYPKPTLEQLEALYQEGKELVRLQEEAEAEKLKLRQEQDTKATAAATVTTDTEDDNNHNVATLQSTLENDHHDDVKGPDHAPEPFTSPPPSPSPPPLPLTPVASNIKLEPQQPTSSQYNVVDDDENSSDDCSKLAPTIEQEDKSPVSDFAPDITAILATPSIRCVSPPPPPQQRGTQTSSKIKLWFHEDRSSIYPSDESSLAHSDGCRTPRPSTSALEIRNINDDDQDKENRGDIAITKIRKARSVSPGGLQIRPIFEVLEQSRRSSLVRPPPEPTVDLAGLPSPDEFELEDDSSPITKPADEDVSVACLPDPSEFEFSDVALTPPASPKIRAVELDDAPPTSFFQQGAAFLKKELERIKQRIETGTFDATPWDRPSSPPPVVTKLPTTPDPLSSSKLKRSPLSVEGLRLPDLAILKGLYRIKAFRTPTPRSPLSPASALSLASNYSMQALASENSGILTPSVESPSPGAIISADQVLDDLPPSTEAAIHEGPVEDAVEVPSLSLAENLQKSKETLTRSLTSGFSSLLKRFGVQPADPSSSAPEPRQPSQLPQTPAQKRVGRVLSAESFVIATPPSSPTPSNLAFMRQILGRKVEGTLSVPDVATASPGLARLATSSGFLTADYTDTLSVEYVNEFDGFNWEAQGGSNPWYRDPMPWAGESAESPYLPEAQSTGAGQFAPPVTTSQVPAARATDLVASSASTSPVASLAPNYMGCHHEGSLSSSRSQVRLGSPVGSPSRRGAQIVTKPSEHVPRYDPTPHRDACLSTCGLDLNVERSFYMSYEDRLKQAVKPWMRGRSSTNF